MKIKFIFLGLVGLISVSSFAQKRATKAEIDASNVIQFGNTVIDLGNFYSETLKNYDGIFSIVEDNIQKLTRNPNVQPFAVNCIRLAQTNSRIEEAYKTEVKKTFTFTEKAELKLLVEKAKADTKNVEKWCTQLSNYFSNKEYSSDTEFKNSYVLVDSLSANIDKARASWRAASNLASDAGSRAELVVLKGSKIADFIIPMKTDLESLRKILEQLQTEHPDVSALKQDINTLDMSIKANKDITNKDVSKLSDVYYKEVYRDFYTNTQACIDYLNSIVLAIETGKIDERTNDQFRYMSSKYGEAVGKYNTFVSQ